MQERSPNPAPAAPPLPSPSPPAAPAARGSWLKELRDRDHTRGSLLVSILALSIPAIVMSLVGGGLFQMVELWMLGEIGPDAIAIAGATNQTLRQFFFLMVFGMTVASQMMIARLVGEGSVEGAEHVAGQTFAIAVAMSIGIAAIGLLFAGPLAALVVAPDLAGAAGDYTRIVFMLLGAMILMQTLSSVLSGAGDATTPMLVTLTLMPLSIVFQYALAFGAFGFPALGLNGIALGAIGGFLGVAALGWALGSGRARVHLRRHHLKPDFPLIGRLLSLSWQPALHMLARTAVIFFFMVLAGSLGGKVQAAYTIGLRIEMVAIMIAFPVANAASTLVGQNLGAGQVRRAWQSIGTGVGLELLLLWPLALAIFFLRHEMAGFFTDDPEVLALASEYLAFSSVHLSFYGIYFVAFRSLQAAGDMNSPMIISLIVALGLGVPLGWYLATLSELGATGMWIGNLAYGIVNTLLMAAWLATGRWSRRPPADI